MQINKEKQQNGKGQRSLPKIGDIKGIISCKEMGLIKDRNSKNLTEADGRGDKNIQKNCTKRS